MLFEKYMICEDGFGNTYDENGWLTGFQFKLRISYYRALRLSMIEDIQVTVDGKTFPSDKLLFTVEEGTFTLAQMKTMPDLYWDFGEPAVIRVVDPDGLGRGNNPEYRRLRVYLKFRVSYSFTGFSAATEKVLKPTL